MHLARVPILAGMFAVSLCGAPAFAGSGPVIVVPGRPGVPVMVDGVDVSGAVIYGDWGLARPGHGQLIIEGPVVYTAPWIARGYYPSAGHAPRYGRLEIEPPPQRRPRPSTSFSRSWSAEPDTTRPVTEYPPFNPPPVIVAPQPALPRARHR
jgi:hypothetical protein